MYAVIRTGGKQYRVEEGDTLEVELLGEVGSTLEVQPLMVVDGDAVQATPSQLDGAKVAVEVVGETKGPKINGFTYKSKSNQRRRWGHRQQYHTITVTSISKGKG
jgi:large subunit ribosomal protein L21